MRPTSTDAPNQLNFFAAPPTLDRDSSPSATNERPWAYALRPHDWELFQGQPHLNAWKNSTTPPPGLIMWGPSGCGKTTLAFILAKQWSIELSVFNAVLSGVPELRKLINSIAELKQIYPTKRYGIFIDEIHRFNRSQQDALLPYVEAGDFILFGATTENPRVSVNRALLSRMQVLELIKLSSSELTIIIRRACQEKALTFSEEIIELIATHSSGDARRALGNLQELHARSGLSDAERKSFILQQARHYDKSSDRHYDVISAFIKSMRATDPQASLLYLAIMLDGGEDPVFIARRLVIFSSEDVGNADPRALPLATATLSAVKNIGMPEARIILAHATTFLASALKSNASYQAIDQALEFVRNHETIDVPDYFKGFPPANSDQGRYLYPHDLPFQVSSQPTTVLSDCPDFYRPKKIGAEADIAEYLNKIKELKLNSPQVK